MKYIVLPYKTGSQSAKDIARGLGLKRVRLNNCKISRASEYFVINWGCSERVPSRLSGATFLNHPGAVLNASNKLRSFRIFNDNGVPTVPNTNSKEEAVGWLEEGKTVLCRTRLSGNSGDGIVVCESVDDLVDAALYTQYVPKRYEYRIHVAGGQVLDTQRKARSSEVPDDQVDWRIRNHHNGFIFARNEDHQVPECVTAAAIQAVDALGLDFGAVDVGYNQSRDKAYVYEVNTACGVTGTTLDNYLEYFNSVMESNNA